MSLRFQNRIPKSKKSSKAAYECREHCFASERRCRSFSFHRQNSVAVQIPHSSYWVPAKYQRILLLRNADKSGRHLSEVNNRPIAVL
ncbi:MAG: PAN domain-containing protein [Anaerovoracaceae bacterium]